MFTIFTQKLIPRDYLSEVKIIYLRVLFQDQNPLGLLEVKVEFLWYAKSFYVKPNYSIGRFCFMVS